MRPIVYREFAKKRRFGVELEVSPSIKKERIGELLNRYEFLIGRGTHVQVTSGDKGWKDTHRNNYWHVKYDSTCGPRTLEDPTEWGWEIASYIASGAQDAHHISVAARYLSKFGLKSNVNCGLHVHAEVKEFSAVQMGKLFARWIKLEPFLLKLCEPHRADNIYCRTLGWRKQELGVHYDPARPQDFWSLMQPRDHGVHGNYEKRYALNAVGYGLGKLVPTHTRHTVELRLPECKLDAKHILFWTMLYVNFVETCSMPIEAPKDLRPARNVSEALALLGLQGADEFLVLDEELLQVKKVLLEKLSSNDFTQDVKEEAKDQLQVISQI